MIAAKCVGISSVPVFENLASKAVGHDPGASY